MFRWENKEFWTDQTKAKRQKILDEWKQGKELDYDDDTEICGYHKNGSRYEVWLAVYDGGLEWTLNEYSKDGEEWENVYFDDWNVENIATLRECDLETYARLQYHKLLKEYKDQQKEERDKDLCWECYNDIYLEIFYDNYDQDQEPVCFNEFYDNEWQDEDYKDWLVSIYKIQNKGEEE